MRLVLLPAEGLLEQLTVPPLACEMMLMMLVMDCEQFTLPFTEVQYSVLPLPATTSTVDVPLASMLPDFAVFSVLLLASTSWSLWFRPAPSLLPWSCSHDFMSLSWW